MYEEGKGNPDDFRMKAYQSFKNAGILDSIKAQSRVKIFEQLKKNSRDGNDVTSIKSKLSAKSNNLVYKLCISLINDFLKKNELAFTMSVLIPESGIGTQTLTKTELEDVLKLKAEKLNDEDDGDLEKINSPLLQDIVESMRRGNSIRPNQVTCSVQTSEGEEGLTLDQKLKQLDLKYMETATAERVMPHKVLEERMLKYKRECDERAAKEIQAEVARVKEIEISHVKLEQAAAYRAKLAEFRNELDTMHKDKIKELKIRENEIIQRCKIKENEIEAAAFEHRQKVLKDMETLRYKEQENKKTVEMELMLIKNEREKFLAKEKECDLKLKDLQLLKIALEKKTQSEIEEYKRKFTGDRDDEKRDLHIRRMQLEEDEHRFAMNKDKFLVTEKDKIQVEKENVELKDKLDKITEEHQSMTKEYIDIKDQLKVLSSNGMRDNEIIHSKTAQAETYENEAKTLRELLQAQKDMLKKEKETNDEVIGNLRQQLKEQKDTNNRIKEQLISESERQAETYKNAHRAEKDRLKNEIDSLSRKVEVEQHLTKELTIANDKLVKDHHGVGSMMGGGSDRYNRGDIASVGVRQADFLTANGIPLISNIVDPGMGQEYLERQRNWDNLNDANRDVKRDINKVGLVPITEKIVQPYYDIEKEDSPLEPEPLTQPISSNQPIGQSRPTTYTQSQSRSPQKFDSFAQPSSNTNLNRVERRAQDQGRDDMERLEAQLEAAEKEEEQKNNLLKERKEREQRMERERKDREDRQRKERLDREKREREAKEKRDREQRQREEEKKATPSAPSAGFGGMGGISASVKNPFAKKMGGSSNRKLDPLDKPKSGGSEVDFKKQDSGIKDNYGLDDFDINQDPQDEIEEDIEDVYSSFNDNSGSDGFNF